MQAVHPDDFVDPPQRYYPGGSAKVVDYKNELIPEVILYDCGENNKPIQVRVASFLDPKAGQWLLVRCDTQSDVVNLDFGLKHQVNWLTGMLKPRRLRAIERGCGILALNMRIEVFSRTGMSGKVKSRARAIQALEKDLDRVFAECLRFTESSVVPLANFVNFVAKRVRMLDMVDKHYRRTLLVEFLDRKFREIRET